MPFKKSCDVCSREFTSSHNTARFCGKQCRKKHYSTQTYKPSGHDGLSTGTVGSIAELMVAADLMHKGFDVYRACSPHSYCDLIAIKGERVMQIEVRTGRYTYKGNKMFYPKMKIGNKSIVVVTHIDHRIHYLSDPDLSTANGPYKSISNESISSDETSLNLSDN